jgi:hypothetical protein
VKALSLSSDFASTEQVHDDQEKGKVGIPGIRDAGRSNVWFQRY